MTGPVPYRVEGVRSAADVVGRHEDLTPGESSGDVVTVSGRLVLMRRQGKLCFATMADWTGRIQLWGVFGTTAAFDEFSRLSLGDWVAATGEVVRTRRGELSVRVSTWSLLAATRLGFGDKWRGMRDPDLRYRQREVDLWANEGVRERFLRRSAVVSEVRSLMDARCFVEVETPVLVPLHGGANARPFVTHFQSMHADFYLRIATELYLKRLVVGGFERVYELGRIFRNEGVDAAHNPEFTMLEAYQVHADYLDMAELVEHLVSGAASVAAGGTQLVYQGRPLDLSPPWRRASLIEVIEEVTGAELDVSMKRPELVRRAGRLGVELDESFDNGQIVAEIYEKTTEPKLWEPVHVMDYPESVSPLTRKHRSKLGCVERATSVAAGQEIAECYSELIDPDDPGARFVAQQAAAAAGNAEAMSLDEPFLRALAHGMPPTGGIGLGVDRLVMLLTDVSHIREVLLFPALRPEAGSEEA